MCNANECSSIILLVNTQSRHIGIQSRCGNKNILITMVHSRPQATVGPTPYSQSVAVRCKLEDVKLISGSIQWPTGGQCDDWHFMPLTRRSTEGILDVVSEQSKHTGISFFVL